MISFLFRKKSSTTDSSSRAPARGILRQNLEVIKRGSYHKREKASPNGVQSVIGWASLLALDEVLDNLKVVLISWLKAKGIVYDEPSTGSGPEPHSNFCFSAHEIGAALKKNLVRTDSSRKFTCNFTASSIPKAFWIILDFPTPV